MKYSEQERDKNILSQYEKFLIFYRKRNSKLIKVAIITNIILSIVMFYVLEGTIIENIPYVVVFNIITFFVGKFLINYFSNEKQF